MKAITAKQKAFDYAIRDSEISSESDYGYKINGKEPYENYMSKKAWDIFLKQMSKEHRRQFEDGDGGELEEKKGRYGLNPPKMACFGSSSKFIYQYSEKIDGFCFEKKMPTHVGHTANLDGYITKDNIEIYVEAKRREIYESHKNNKINKVYKQVYDYINKKYPDFEYIDNNQSDKEKDYFNCTFKYKKQIIVHFDLKQLICHFLGITANILKKEHSNKIRFIYLIFNPNAVKDKIDERYKDDILSIYNETTKEISNMGDMCWLFEAVLEFQKVNLNKSLSKNPSFEFSFTAQANYSNTIKRQ